MKFLKKHAATIIAVVIGALVSAYFFMIAIEKRDPIFSVEKKRTLIADPVSSISSKLKITRQDGTPIKGQVWLVSFYFWNNGNTPIRNKEILSPVEIFFKDPSVEILDYLIVREKRPAISKTKLSLKTTQIQSFIQIDFSILENKDAIEGQIFYSGKEDAAINIRGIIESVDGISTEPPSNWGQYAYRWLTVVGAALAIGAVMAIALFIGLGYQRVVKLLPEKYHKTAINIPGSFLIVLIIVLIIYVILSGAPSKIPF